MSVSPNSAKVYHEEIKGQKENSQNKLILKIINASQRALCMREIEDISGLRESVVSRTLNNLFNLNLVDRFDAITNYTGKPRRVHHYRSKDNQLTII